MQRSELLSILSWLIEAGADAALNDEATDHFARAAPKPAARAAVTPITEPAHPGTADADTVGSAVEIAARCRNLAELRAALEQFEGCALKAHASHTVFADGTPAHGIMCIGEAPGREEDRQGLPFVGRAGQLLDKMLAAIGLDRTKVYIVNVLPWRPPDNRNPDPTEVAKCIPFLRRHIELAEPKLIALLGAVAVRHVLGRSDGIMRLRGTWHDYLVGGRTVPVMPTLHPAYLLRRPIDKRLAWRDLQAFEQRLAAIRAPSAAAASSSPFSLN